MVKVSALSKRPYSDWALDIPSEAYFRMDDDIMMATGTIVTEPTALNLYCMGSRLRPQLENTLESFRQKQVDRQVQEALLLYDIST